MSNILIVNLKGATHILESNYLICSLKQHSHKNNISLLVYKKYEKVAETLINVDKCFSIDRHEITTFCNNKLFSNGYAINSFKEALDQVDEQEWDEVINYSNDIVGANLISYFGKEKYSGICISNTGTVDYSNTWSLLLNEVMTGDKNPPCHLVDCYHKVVGIPFHHSDVSIKTLPEHNESAHRHLTELRKRVGGDSCELKIVAIQLSRVTTQKEIPFLSLKLLLDKILDEPTLYPVLLISSNERDKKVSNELNKLFDNSLVTIESDLVAISSVLMNIDLLLTAHSSLKYLADMTQTPVLEISYDPTHLFKYATTQEDNIVLHVEQYPGEDVDLNSNLADDIFNIISKVFFGQNSASHLNSGWEISEGSVLYKVQHDSMGIWYQAQKGHENAQDSLCRTIARLFINQLLGDPTAPIEFNDLTSNYLPEVLSLWVKEEKKQITQLLKNLLQTLRMLNQTKINPTNGSDVVTNLQSILSFENYKSVLAIPILIFRGKLESIQGETLQENIIDMEALCFDLKKKVQLLNNLYTSLTVSITQEESKQVMARIDSNTIRIK